LRQSFDVELGVVQLGAADHQAVVFEKAPVEIAHRERHAIRGQQQVGIGKLRCGRCNQSQLNRPVGQFRGNILAGASLSGVSFRWN